MRDHFRLCTFNIQKSLTITAFVRITPYHRLKFTCFVAPMAPGKLYRNLTTRLALRQVCHEEVSASAKSVLGDVHSSARADFN